MKFNKILDYREIYTFSSVSVHPFSNSYEAGFIIEGIPSSFFTLASPFI